MADYSSLIGQTYGYWTVVGLAAAPRRVRCKCRCGTERDVAVSQLKTGGSKSCGCMRLKKDGTPCASMSAVKKIEPGQRFERLVALEPTEKRSGSNVVWKCRCDCGKIAEVSANFLRRGVTQSCGCLAEEAQSKTAKSMREKLEPCYVDGTNVNVLLLPPTKRNTSGKTGVFWDKSNCLWKAKIMFKGRSYYLGSSKDIDHAIKLREEAEKRIHGAFLDWYYETFPERKRRKSK